MKKITLLLVAAAICVCAADFWQTKPYTDWSDKDIQKIETNSPWSKQVTVALPEGGGGSGKGGGKRGGNNASELEGAGGGLSNGGNAGRNTGVQDVGGSSIPSGGSSGLSLTVSWRTALPVREAVAKQKFGDQAATSADAKKMIDEEQKVYAIMVTGLPGRALRSDKLKETLLKSTELLVKGKDPIAPSDVQVGGNEQRALVLFIFPKTSPLSLDDKDVEFSTKLGALIVKQKFHLKDMVFNGKLDL
jgi:hypothetical protein